MSNPNPPNQFKPGNQVALGSDKTQRVSTWIEKELEELLSDTDATVLGYEKNLQKKRAIAKKLISMALQAKDNGLSMAAIKEVLDRTEGKAAQSLKLSGDAENPLNVLFVKPEKNTE